MQPGMEGRLWDNILDKNPVIDNGRQYLMVNLLSIASWQIVKSNVWLWVVGRSAQLVFFFFGGGAFCLLSNGVYGSRCPMGFTGLEMESHLAWFVLMALLDSNQWSHAASPSGFGHGRTVGNRLCKTKAGPGLDHLQAFVISTIALIPKNNFPGIRVRVETGYRS